MTLRAPFVPAPCAEFPNDNPALHYGASWVCLAPLGPTRAIVRPTPVRNAHLQDPPPQDHRAPPVGQSAQEAAPANVPLVQSAQRAAPANSIAEHGSDTAELAFRDAMKRRLLWPADIAEIVEAWLLPPAAAPEEGLEAMVARAMAARLLWSPELREVMELIIADAEREESLDDAAPAAWVDGEVDFSPVSNEVAAIGPPSEAREGRGGTERPLQARARDSVANPGLPDGFLAFVRALVEVALNSGATRAAAVIPTLFELGCIDASALDAETAESLQKRGIVDRRGGGFTVTEEFALTAGAWRDVLRGQSEDLAACGTSTLDTWAADLLRALRVAADDGRDVRRELRRRGVAAFGMLLAA